MDSSSESARKSAFSPDESQLPHETLLHQALIELQTDLPIAEFLRTHFADRHYTELREAVRRRAEVMMLTGWFAGPKADAVARPRSMRCNEAIDY
jgi:hypothetical protein